MVALVAVLPGAQAGTPPPGFVETQVVDGSFANGAAGATAIAYEPGNGNLWFTEKGDGSIAGEARVRVRNTVSAAVTTALTLSCVDSRFERGLLGIAFSPDFLDPGGLDRHVYFYYTPRIESTGPCSVMGQAVGTRFRVSRFTESGSMLAAEEVVLEGPILNAALNHNAGTIRFASDKTLFIATGDNDTDGSANPLSRDMGDLRGKLLRINKDGTIPANNPFVGQAGVREEIWAYGLRNPFRFSIDEDSAAPIIGDVGESTWEAIYLGIPGADYGYPCIEGSAPFRNCSPAPPAGSITAPAYEYGHGTQTLPVFGGSVTGGPVYRAAAFPAEYQGSYFFGDYVSGWIRRGRLTGDGRLVDVEMFMPNAFNVVDLAVSPAGCLTWVRISGGTSGGVREVCYVGGANGQPRAVASAMPISGLANLAVQFAGSGSTDPDSNPLAYSWDFGDSASSDLADPNHLYTSDGVYEAVLTVDDQQAAVNSMDKAPPIRIVVGNRRPLVTIAAPASGARYDAGDTIAFSGTASDPEDGSLAAGRMAWTVVFHHGTHTHPFLGPVTGVSSGSFTIPTTGEDAADVFYRVHSEATDSGAPLGAVGELSHTAFVDVMPNVSTLTMETFPGGFGLDLVFDQQSIETPSQHLSVAGFPRTIGAPTPQTTGGRTFHFQSWSDAGAVEHGITTPAIDSTYVATFAITCASVNDLPLNSAMVTTTEAYEACGSITVGPDYTIQDSGEVSLTAGVIIAFQNGFSVEPNGVLTAVNIPMI